MADLFTPMQCSEYAPHKLSDTVYVQEKLDGICCIVHPDGTLATRQGKIWNKGVLPFLSKLRCPYPIIGELHVHERNVSYVQELAAVTRTTPHPNVDELHFTPFDVAAINFNMYHERFMFISGRDLTNIIHPWTYLYNKAEIPSVFDKIKDAKKEGLVIRNPHCPYVPGIKSPNQQKLKVINTMEVIARERFRGQGKHRDKLGTITCTIPGSILTVDVGGGFTDDDRYDIYDNFGKYKDQPMTIAYERLSDYGVPLKPRFVSWRNYE